MADRTSRTRRSRCFYGHVIEVERTERKTDLGTPIVRLTLEVGEDLAEAVERIVRRPGDFPYCCAHDAIVNGAVRPFVAEWTTRTREQDVRVRDAVTMLEAELGPGAVKGELGRRVLPHLRAADPIEQETVARVPA